ncbi:MAG: SelT/SelW/SelH family protein [Proteobacteria bacterium]|nr:SelT/SelW/SelH family protein [Burkholderiales bacterium]
MAAELKREFQVEATLIKSSGGVFEVDIDGARVYSKTATGQFPQAGEVIGRVRTLRASG